MGGHRCTHILLIHPPEFFHDHSVEVGALGPFNNFPMNGDCYLTFHHISIEVL